MDTTAVTPEVIPTATDLIQYTLTFIIGVVSPTLYALLEKLAPTLRGLNATAKRALVSLIPAAASLLLAWLKSRYEWLPIDVSVLTASVASAIAYAVYAGDAVKEIKYPPATE